VFYEITARRSLQRPLKLRWFTSLDMDLYIWFRSGVPVRFQLNYDKPEKESVIFWNSTAFKTYRIENDEYIHAPIGNSDVQRIARNFLVASEFIETGISDFVYARLMEYPQLQAPGSAGPADHHPVAPTDPGQV
jgi:hypothetical protein